MCSFLRSKALQQNCITIFKWRSWIRIAKSGVCGTACNKCPSLRQAIAIQALPDKHPSLQLHLPAGQSGEWARFVVSVSERSLKNVITRTDRCSMARLVVQAHFEHMMLTPQCLHWQTQQHCRQEKKKKNLQMMRVYFHMLKEPKAWEETGWQALNGRKWSLTDKVGSVKLQKAAFVYLLKMLQNLTYK